MEVIVLSQFGAKKFKSSEPWVAISIVNHGYEHPLLDWNYRSAILQIKFDDSEPPESGSITEDDARKIVDFAKQYWDKVDYFVVHCLAGQSRSPAVAAALMRLHWGTDGDWFKTRTPNRYVYTTVLKVCGLANSY